MQVPEIKNEARDCDCFFASLEVADALQVDYYKSTNTDAAAGSKAQILMQPALPGTRKDEPAARCGSGVDTQSHRVSPKSRLRPSRRLDRRIDQLRSAETAKGKR